MKTVNNAEELKQAMEAKEPEIYIHAPEMVAQVKRVIAIKKYGPIGVAAVAAAIPALIATAPVSAPLVSVVGVTATAATGTAAGGTTAALVAGVVTLALGIGATLLIGMLTDWDYVELPGGIKMSRRGGKA